MVTQQGRDEIQRYRDAFERVMKAIDSGADPDPEAIAYVDSQRERIKELQGMLQGERRIQEVQERLAEFKEAAKRVPHQPHPVIWLEPCCSSCDDYEYERTWSKDNIWESGCEMCGVMMPVKYVLAPDQPLSKAGD
jgi:translation initiation factor 2 beta subunit (eIF-2beta)/eIF-5